MPNNRGSLCCGKKTWSGLVQVLIVAVLLLLTGCNMQRAMLYQPGFYSLDQVKALAQQQGLRLWPTDDAFYLGLVTPGTARTSRGTVVVFHGNAGVAGYRSYYAAALEPLGYRVVLAEYPGYGGRPGKMSEDSFSADAAAIIKQAREDFGGPLFVWGESLGAAVAASAIAGDAPAPDGVVLLTPWDSLLNIARQKFPFLPVRFFLRDRYDSVSNLAGYAGPTAVVVAALDNVVPSERGQTLYRSLGGRKRLWVMEGVGHNNWRVDPSSPMWLEVMDFLASPVSSP